MITVIAAVLLSWTSTAVSAKDIWPAADTLRELQGLSHRLRLIRHAAVPVQRLSPSPGAFIAEIRRRFGNAKRLDPDKNAPFVFHVAAGRWSCRGFLAATGEHLAGLSFDYTFSRFDSLLVRSSGSYVRYHAITAGGLVDDSGAWIRLIPGAADKSAWDMIMEETIPSAGAHVSPVSLADPDRRALSYAICVKIAD